MSQLESICDLGWSLCLLFVEILFKTICAGRSKLRDTVHVRSTLLGHLFGAVRTVVECWNKDRKSNGRRNF